MFGYKPSTPTGTLHRLEAAELLLREPSSFRVTERGAEVATELRERLEVLEADITGSVAEREMAGFTAVMAAVGRITQVQLRAATEGES